MVRYIGYDPLGIKRVWGEGKTEEQASNECQKACNDYVKQRPDCWPMTIKKEK